MVFNINFAKEKARIYLTTVFLDHLRKKNPLFNRVKYIVMEDMNRSSESEFFPYHDPFQALNLFFVCTSSEKMQQLGQFLQDTLMVKTLTNEDLTQHAIVGLRNTDISKLLAYFPTREFGETYEQLLTKILPDSYPRYLQFFKELQDLTRYLDATAQHVGKTLPVDTGVIFQDAILRYAGLQIERESRSYQVYGSNFDIETGRYVARYKLDHPEDLERVREAVNHHWQAEDQIINAGTGEIRFFINWPLIRDRIPILKITCTQRLIEAAEIENRENLSDFVKQKYSEFSFFYRSSLMTTEDFIGLINPKIETLNGDLIANLSQRPRSCSEYFRILTDHFLGPKYIENYHGPSSHISCLSAGKLTYFMKQVTARQRVDVGDYLCCFLPHAGQDQLLANIKLFANIKKFIDNLRTFAIDHTLEQDVVFLASKYLVVMREFSGGRFMNVPYYAVVIKAPFYLMILNHLLPEEIRKNATLWLEIFKESSPKNKNPQLLQTIEEISDGKKIPYDTEYALRTIYETAFPIPESVPLPGLTLSTP